MVMLKVIRSTPAPSLIIFVTKPQFDVNMIGFTATILLYTHRLKLLNFKRKLSIRVYLREISIIGLTPSNVKNDFFAIFSSETVRFNCPCTNNTKNLKIIHIGNM